VLEERRGETRNKAHTDGEVALSDLAISKKCLELFKFRELLEPRVVVFRRAHVVFSFKEASERNVKSLKWEPGRRGAQKIVLYEE